MRATVVMLMLLGTSGMARADWQFTLDPPVAQDGDLVNLRVANPPSDCTPFAIPAVVREGNTVRVSFEINDSIPPGPCPADRMAPRLHSLGTFALGTYVVEVSTCSNAPGGPSCTRHATLNLLLLGSDGRVLAVPVTNWPALVLLAMAVSLASVGSLRRR